MNDLKPEIVDQIPHPDRHDNRLVRRDATQRATIEMIEMRMGHEHEIDLREMMNLESGLF